MKNGSNTLDNVRPDPSAMIRDCDAEPFSRLQGCYLHRLAGTACLDGIDQDVADGLVEGAGELAPEAMERNGLHVTPCPSAVASEKSSADSIPSEGNRISLRFIEREKFLSTRTMFFTRSSPSMWIIPPPPPPSFEVSLGQVFSAVSRACRVSSSECGRREAISVSNHHLHR